MLHDTGNTDFSLHFCVPYFFQIQALFPERFKVANIQILFISIDIEIKYQKLMGHNSFITKKKKKHYWTLVDCSLICEGVVIS